MIYSQKLLIEFLRRAPPHFSEDIVFSYFRWCLEHGVHSSRPDFSNHSDIEFPRSTSEYLREFAAEFSFAPWTDLKVSSLLLEDYGIDLMWCLHETPHSKSGRAIYSLLPSFSPMEVIRRGGVNVYKRYSWTVHVLRVCTMIWKNIPQRALPITKKWPENMRSGFGAVCAEYEVLSGAARKLLRLASIMHDIGVKDGVEDHDRNGIKYVEAACNSFGGAETISGLLDNELDSDEVLIFLRACVAEHTLASKVNGELGHEVIRKRLCSWRDSFEKLSSGRRFFEQTAPRILGTLFLADLTGVSDDLLTEASVKNGLIAINELNDCLIGEGKVHQPTVSKGLARLANLIGADAIVVERLLAEAFGHGPNWKPEILAVGGANTLNYSINVLKGIRDRKISAAVLLCFASLWLRKYRGNSVPLALSFAPDCNPEIIAKWVQHVVESSGATSISVEALDAFYRFGVRIQKEDLSLRIDTIPNGN